MKARTLSVFQTTTSTTQQETTKLPGLLLVVGISNPIKTKPIYNITVSGNRYHDIKMSDGLFKI